MITTVQQHIRHQQQNFAEASGAQRVLDLQPESIHQRTPFVVGSRREVESLQSLIKETN
jgi:fructose-1,6-bisphosphatase I